MKNMRIKIPERVVREMEALVKQGWFASQEDIINQALHRFLDAHRPELMEKFIQDDVDWGLRGKT